ncbi:MULTISPECIES: glycosyltransferase family 2 protein [unclassified Aureimonas]|uniref:glycosyltransferase family 2 protein n=1 Tax=unclassified Aureimonas TaxID=2615206 RepID=UPI0006FF618F|nr:MULTISPECIES: glycosyltransferase [unclassified Aureimonas]KQT70067.1 hypothetical protein ASG62_01470 [Aureimonas sp. Leaf427]KQT76289.1 hypothetical protein ASG54_14750 [Aureimonas sp. Leaf460]
MTKTVTIEVRSPGLEDTAPRVVVTLPTFRRPEHLLKTLESLAAQTLAEPVAIVVMENDAERREGLRAAEPLFRSGRLRGLVLVAHDRGNCFAYNAGWETALAEFPAMEHLLVIDDDEIAVPDWTRSLVGLADATKADIVGGPVLPTFPLERGARLKRHPVFTPPYDTSGPVPILYGSGNVLIRRRVLETMARPYLDPAFNFIGGGDADFFARCRRQGFSFAWSQEAMIAETTPARRMEFSWLQQRGLREGALSTIIERRGAKNPAARAKTLLKSGALLALAPLRSARLALRTRSLVIGLYPMNVAIGRFLGEFGLVHEQYRRPEQN